MTSLELHDDEGAVHAMSESVENYLKAIYKLQTGDDWVSNHAIAKRLNVSPPSVTRMVKRLAKHEWVEHNPYSGVRLTELGTRRALGVIRKHRMLETYLVRILGMSWDEVDGEVERLEHVVSDGLVNLLEEAMGYPSFDPHGSPIPDREGNLPTPDGSVPLTDLPVGARGKITRVADASPPALGYLKEKGLIPGVTIELASREPFDGPHTVLVDGREAHLGAELARRIRVLEEKP